MAFKGQITHLSQKGLGVVQNEQDGISYFVSGTWPGDYGEFEVIDRRLPNKKYGYAKLVQLLQPAVDRQHAPCPFLGTTETACAGCPWMIASYASQLEQKRNRFMYAMKRVGFDTGQLTIPPRSSFAIAIWLPQPLPSQDRWPSTRFRYRRRPSNCTDSGLPRSK